MPVSLLRRSIPGLIVLGLLLFVALHHRSSGPVPEASDATEFIMGTYVRVSLVAGEETAQAVSRMVFEEFRRIESIMSPQMPGSLLYRLNAGLIDSADDAELAQVVRDGMAVGRETNWCFNPAIGPLVKLWDVESPHPRVPPPDSIRIALGRCDPGLVATDGSRVILNAPGASLDLGGIAKGYAIDRGLDIIRGYRIKAGLIDAGGDIGVIGARPAGGPWRIGIQHPRNLERIAGVIKLRDRSVATSGDYQRYFTHQGRRYHHIIDPRTGYPSRPAVSVTVIARSAETADALATAAFVLGMEDGLALLERSPGVEGVIICGPTDGDGEGLTYRATSGLSGKLKLELGAAAD